MLAAPLAHAGPDSSPSISPLGSRSSAGRDRSEKPPASAASSSRPGPFTRAGSTKELLDGPSLDEVRRERGAEPRRPSVSEDKTEPEHGRVRESGERTFTQPLLFFGFLFWTRTSSAHQLGCSLQTVLPLVLLFW